MPAFEISYKEGLDKYNEAIEQAENDLIKRGLPLPERPVDSKGHASNLPQLPENLDSVGFAEIQKLMGIFTQWYEYAVTQLKVTSGRRSIAEKKRNFSWSKIRRSKEGTVADKDDAVRTDIRYIEEDADYEYYSHHYNILQGIVDGLKRDIETISRIVSVMESRTNVEGRGVAISRTQRFGSKRESRFRNKALDPFRKGR